MGSPVADFRFVPFNATIQQKASEGQFLEAGPIIPSCNITAEPQQRRQVLFIEAKIDSSICSNEVVHPIHLPRLA